MASNSIESNAIAYIDEIYTISKSKRFSSLIKKINSFVQYINSNPLILYSNVNRYFYKIGLAPILMSYCIHLPNESGTDILRLLHMFVKTNGNIADLVRKSNTFMGYLSKSLNSENVWHYMEIFKYHIHLATFLILNSNANINFDSITVIKKIRRATDDSADPKNTVVQLIFHACLMPVQKFDSIYNYINDFSMEKQFTRIIVKTFTSLVEDYQQHFTSFYANPENENNPHIVFSLKSEFSFEEICHAICHYAHQSEAIYAEFLESGVCQIISQLFLIKYIPHHLILKSLDILMIPSQFLRMSSTFGRENLKLRDSLHYYLNNHSHSDEVNGKIDVIVKLYWTSRYEDVDNTINTSTNETVTLSSGQRIDNSDRSYLLSGRNFDSFHMDDWLMDNNLERLCPIFRKMSWKGLYMLQTLLHEDNGRHKVMKMLTSKLDLDFGITLEFVECLENLSFH